MTNEPFGWWKTSTEFADFSAPELCRTRLTTFERTIRRRNAIEYAAGALVAVLFGGALIGSLAAGEWAFALAGALTLAGTAMVLVHLRRFGSNLDPNPALDCRSHLMAQLTRQQALLRKVPQWYLAPLVPGICAFYGITAAKVAQVQGWATALEGIWLPLLATALFFAFVAWLNLSAARKLDEELGRLRSA